MILDFKASYSLNNILLNILKTPIIYYVISIQISPVMQVRTTRYKNMFKIFRLSATEFIKVRDMLREMLD